MHAWHDYLRTVSAPVFSEQTLQHFGNESAERLAINSHTILCDLSHLGLLEISGSDAYRFLQGQLTNDIHVLDGTCAQFTGYCTPKGRLLAVFLAFAHANHVHLQCAYAIQAGIVDRLRRYVLRNDVQIKAMQDTVVTLGISGERATEILLALFGQVPVAEFALHCSEQATLLKLPGVHPRYQIFTSWQNAPKIWQTLSAQTYLVGAPVWELLEIKAGIPTIFPATQDLFTPHALGLDKLGGISFSKGCYVGQEIVARTQYLGKSKRGLYQAHSHHALAVGDIVYSGETEVGHIVRVAADAQGYALLVTGLLEVIQPLSAQGGVVSIR